MYGEHDRADEIKDEPFGEGGERDAKTEQIEDNTVVNE
jgi:hypothetical protein